MRAQRNSRALPLSADTITDTSAYTRELASLSLARRNKYPAERASRRFIIALLIALLLHAVLLVILIDQMRPPSTTQSAGLPVIHLRLIDESPALPAVPVPETPTPAKPALPTKEVRVETRENPVATTPEVQMKAAVERLIGADTPIIPASAQRAGAPPRAVAEPIGIFHRDGSVVLPSSTQTTTTADFDSRPKVKAFTPNPMAHDSPLPYKPTMFEKVWVPLDETPLGTLVRKATVSKSWDTQGGTRITCTSFLIFSGCGWGHAPRVTIDELKKMRADLPMPRQTSDGAEVQPQ